MTNPTDDLEAVRAVTEALRGFQAQDQERIIRWAREKLNLVATPAAQPPKAIAPIRLANTFEPASPPAATPPNRNLTLVERPAPEVPAVRQPEAEPVIAWQPEGPPVEVREVEIYQGKLAEVEPPAEQPPGAVGVLMPEPEQKSRLPLVIGVVVLTIALAFLIFMIVSTHPK